MFSNQSVRVQPSPPPTDTGTLTPESASVCASLRNSGQVLGGVLMPALENAFVLYQTVDLLDASTGTPYTCPL
jgi:hypothetical protein